MAVDHETSQSRTVQTMQFQHVRSSKLAIHRSLSYHAFTLYLFTCNNLKDIVILGYAFGVLGALSGPTLGFGAPKGLIYILYKTPAMLFWSWINLLLFNLHNQRHPEAIHEDAINKPWRPLPAGRLNPSEATTLMHAVYPIVLLSSAALGGLGPCLVEAFSCLWYNEWRGAESPVLKNLLNATGFACFLAGPLEIATGGASVVAFPAALHWLAIIAVAIFFTVHTQDLRDQAGDRMRLRQTLPLLIGDAPARWVVVVAVACCSCWATAFWRLGVAALAVPAGAGTLLVGNLLRKRTVGGDVMTWKLWPVWMASLFCLPLIKMHSGA